MDMDLLTPTRTNPGCMREYTIIIITILIVAFLSAPCCRTLKQTICRASV